MTPLFKKLNLGIHTSIVVVNAPESFQAELALLDGVTVTTTVKKSFAFAMAFVQTLKEIEKVAAWVPKADGDAILWMVYPKGTSKNYTCEFNRDTGWASLGMLGWEPVRMVAIDADWSALRFRKVEFVKTMTRAKEHALSLQGKAKTK